LSEKLPIKTHKTIILYDVLYDCETWFHVLREEHRLRVYEEQTEENIWT